MNSRHLPRAMALLLLVTSSLPGTAAHTYSKGQPQLRVLAVPLLPTSPTMDMMAVAAELKARCVQYGSRFTSPGDIEVACWM